MEPTSEAAAPTPGLAKRQKATGETFRPGESMELVVLSIKEKSARCRIPAGGGEITLRAGRLWEAVPGEIITVTVGKQWFYAGHPYLSGDMTAHRLDVAAIGLEPVPLKERRPWDPKVESWREKGRPLESWARAIVARGTRSAFVMGPSVSGTDPEDSGLDPILEASDRNAAGDPGGARKILMDLLEVDLGCLDAHAHLGNFTFDAIPEEAMRHYEVGMRIGELSLSDGFDGLLPWKYHKNRPYLRCLHGYGLCLWRLGRPREAGEVFERILWLNPADDELVQLLLNPIRMGEVWKDDDGKT